MNCWEMMRCGREAGGARSAELGVCPAYPDHGHVCSRVAGTLCAAAPAGAFARGRGCLRCPFFLGPWHEKPRPYGAGGGLHTRFAK